VKKTIALVALTAFALVGGLAVYLLAHVAFRLRNVQSVNKQRLLLAALLLLFVPVADQPDAIVTMAIVTTAMVVLIAYEATHYAEARDQIRHQ